MIKPELKDKNWTTFYKGHFPFCNGYHVALNCPTPKEDSECKEAFEYEKCIHKGHA